MAVDELRRRVATALRNHGPEHSGPMPSCDTMTQATFILLAGGLSIAQIAGALERTPTHIRVIKRNLTLKMGVAPKRPIKSKQGASHEAATKTPELSLDELFALCEKLRAGLHDTSIARPTRGISVSKSARYERPLFVQAGPDSRRERLTSCLQSSEVQGGVK
jgi:hypothetical protein